MKNEREAFKAWVLKHPDNLNITSYEEGIMFDAWLASASREGYKLVPIDSNEGELKRICDVLGDATVEYKATLVVKNT